MRKVLCLVFVCMTFYAGCNRAYTRIPGTAAPFSRTTTQYRAKIQYPCPIVVLTPTDTRPVHYGEHVAGTNWTACSTDASWNENMPLMIQERLTSELRASGLFSAVRTVSTRPNDVVMRTEIQAFCSQAVGFVFIRVAGISVLKVTLEQNGKMLFDYKFEKVITDADKEYTGSQVTFIEEAMRMTMTDSLRELIRDMLGWFESEVPTWPNPAERQNVNKELEKT